MNTDTRERIMLRLSQLLPRSFSRQDHLGLDAFWSDSLGLVVGVYGPSLFFKKTAPQGEVFWWIAFKKVPSTDPRLSSWVWVADENDERLETLVPRINKVLGRAADARKTP